MNATDTGEDEHDQRADPPVPVLAVRSLTRRFPGVTAVDNVSMTINPGEIVALLGQNGAGKSTLIQIIAGLHPAASFTGDIHLAGKPYRPHSVAEAEAAGVALVPQEINVAPEMSVAENLFLNFEPQRWGFLDQPLRLARASEALRGFGLDIDPALPMRALDLATQQLALIARALSKKAGLLILDEPTAALTEGEAQRLFDHMRRLAALGMAIIFVTHRLTEVFVVSNRIIIMRDGRICGTHATSAVTRGTIVAEMVGHAVTSTERTQRPAHLPVALTVAGLKVFDPDDPTRLRVRDLSLSLAQGEILGLFGLVGSGCVEAAIALYGAWPGHWEGAVTLDASPLILSSPTISVASGIGYMAQDRRDCLIPDHAVHDNVILASLTRLSPAGFSDDARARRTTLDLVRDLAIKARSIESLVGTLSGGNQQKVQVARWLAAQARILILVDPTRGVDIGARGEIKRIWARLSAEGRSILIASTDAEELVDICDRVIVLRGGRPVGEVDRRNLTEERILGVAAGA